MFVAVPVSEEVRERIKPVLSELSETGADPKVVSIFNLHFTLKFLGDIYEKQIPEIEERLAGIAEKMKGFEISLKGVGVFPSMERISVLWIGTEGSELVSLMKAVGKELDFVRKNEYEEEVAHLTIARVKSGRNKRELQEFVKKFEKKDFGAMRIDKMILFESELRRDGAEYKIVKELGLQ